jgi:hypothetical protein
MHPARPLLGAPGVIIAVPVQHRDLVTTVGPLNPPPPRMETFTWWHWECTVCWATSIPRFMTSKSWDALEVGSWHEEREQCNVEGQLSLFTLTA